MADRSDWLEYCHYNWLNVAARLKLRIASKRLFMRSLCFAFNGRKMISTLHATQLCSCLSLPVRIVNWTDSARLVEVEVYLPLYILYCITAKLLIFAGLLDAERGCRSRYLPTKITVEFCAIPRNCEINSRKESRWRGRSRRRRRDGRALVCVASEVQSWLNLQMISNLRSYKCANLSTCRAITMSQSESIIYLYLLYACVNWPEEGGLSELIWFPTSYRGHLTHESVAKTIISTR